MRDVGKRTLRASSASTSIPGRSASCAASTSAMTEGSSSRSLRLWSWCMDCHETGSSWEPLPASPESASARLGGSVRPSNASHVSVESNG